MEKIKILFVDDINFSHILFKNIVNEPIYECSFATNGKNAIYEIMSKKFDIIFMDIEMPVMNGIEAIKIIKEQFVNSNNLLPIIAFTAHDDNEYREKLLKLGFIETIPKLFTKDTIISIIKKYVSRPEKSYNLKFNSDSLNQSNLEKELVSYFVENTPLVIEELKTAIIGNKWKLIKEQCHKLSNQLNYFGLDEASNIASNMEKIDFEKADILEIKKMVNKIDSDCKIAIFDLKNDFEL